MSDQKPSLLRIQRGTTHGSFTAVFGLPNEAGEVSIPVPGGTAEEDMLEVARDHLHRLMQATVAATADWVVPDDRRQKIDPSRTRQSAFTQYASGDRPIRR